MQLRRILNCEVCALILALAGAGAGHQPAQQVDVSRTDQATPPTDAAAGGQPADEKADSIVDRSGVLVMAHGGDADWNRAVETIVAPLRESYPVEIAFGMARTSTMRDAVERLERQGVNRIAVVRMFISGASFLEDTEYILGLRGALVRQGTTDASTRPLPAPSVPHSTSEAQRSTRSHAMEAPKPINSDAAFALSDEGVAASPLVGDILLDRARSLSVIPSRESVVILAHGPKDDGENERWLAIMRRHAERLGALGQFRDVWCETLREDWSELRAASEERIRQYVRARNDDGQRVIVIPFRVAGFGPYAKVLEGLDYIADGRGFCPHPNMTLWIDQTARARLPSLPAARLGRVAARAD